MWWSVPVRIILRVGEHAAAAWKPVSRTPSFASLSILGVRISEPKQPVSENPRSSATMIRKLGLFDMTAAAYETVRRYHTIDFELDECKCSVKEGDIAPCFPVLQVLGRSFSTCIPPGLSKFALAWRSCPINLPRIGGPECCFCDAHFINTLVVLCQEVFSGLAVSKKFEDRNITVYIIRTTSLKVAFKENHICGAKAPPHPTQSFFLRLLSTPESELRVFFSHCHCNWMVATTFCRLCRSTACCTCRIIASTWRDVEFSRSL